MNIFQSVFFIVVLLFNFIVLCVDYESENIILFRGRIILSDYRHNTTISWSFHMPEIDRIFPLNDGGFGGVTFSAILIVLVLSIFWYFIIFVLSTIAYGKNRTSLQYLLYLPNPKNECTVSEKLSR